jgi:hypothetical protein
MSDEIPSTTPKPYIFVLMPFAHSFDDVYELGIKGAAQDIGAHAERLDDQIFKEGMLERIYNQISRADLLVADLTGRNPNVFYEVGYAHALGKWVILIAHSKKDIPFDLLHHQYMLYRKDIKALKKKLSQKLGWAIGELARGRRTAPGIRLSLRVLDMEIPSRLWTSDAPFVQCAIGDNAFFLPIHLRNDGLEVTDDITHVFLFANPEPAVSPMDQSVGLPSPPIYYGGSFVTSVSLPGPIAGYNAHPADAPDGLTTQFRLRAAFPGVPPAAGEDAAIRFLFSGATLPATVRCRLRFHTRKEFRDFAFTLQVQASPKPTPPAPSG